MFNYDNSINSRSIRFDFDPSTLIMKNNKEAITMTKTELVAHCIQHHEDFPEVGEITTDAARSIVEYFDPNAGLPDISPEEFSEIWNAMVHDRNIMDQETPDDAVPDFSGKNTMTIRELAINWMENADTTPSEIDLDTAADYVSWMDPEADLPDDLTPESFMNAWNDILRSN